MVARLNRVVEIAFDERVCRRTDVDLDIVDSFDKRFSRRVVEDHARFFASATLFSRRESVADQSGIHKVARPESSSWRNSSPGGSRAREDKDAREEAVLKSEKLNYIAVKNDARGFSVS